MSEVADVLIWNVALSDEQVLLLSRGVKCGPMPKTGKVLIPCRINCEGHEKQERNC